jgi:hypothetical protein
VCRGAFTRFDGGHQVSAARLARHAWRKPLCGNGAGLFFVGTPATKSGKPPRCPPHEPGAEIFGHIVDAVGAARAAATDPEQRHPSSVPQPVPGDGLIGIFRTGRQMAAGIADEPGERELIQTHQPGAQQPSRRFPPGPAQLRPADVTRIRPRLPCPCVPRSGQGSRPPRRMSEASRHAAPCSRGQVRGT